MQWMDRQMTLARLDGVWSVVPHLHLPDLVDTCRLTRLTSIIYAQAQRDPQLRCMPAHWTRLLAPTRACVRVPDAAAQTGPSVTTCCYSHSACCPVMPFRAISHTRPSSQWPLCRAPGQSPSPGSLTWVPLSRSSPYFPVAPYPHPPASCVITQVSCSSTDDAFALNAHTVPSDAR